jgi:GNAT superfamily N-acetyltransferase
MGAPEILREWRACVARQVLPGLHGHQAKALADFSFATAAVGHCHSGRIASAVPGRARPASTRRRLERTLANRRIRPARALGELAETVAGRWAGRPIRLILDEVHNGRDLTCLKLSIGYRKRAIPIAATCYHRDRPPEAMPVLVRRLLRRAARHLPRSADVTLLIDRGLTWPVTIDTCGELGWHFVGRAQGTTRLRRRDGSECALKDLVVRPGSRWHGRGRAFKKAGWRELAVTAVWERDCKEPWLLVSDRPGGYQAVRAYAKRFWTEELFRDEKSQALQWQRSRVVDPGHGLRLMTILALAILLLASVGSWVLKSGHRRWLEPRRRRGLSVVQMGLRWLQAALIKDYPMPSGVHLHPP